MTGLSERSEGALQVSGNTRYRASRIAVSCSESRTSLTLFISAGALQIRLASSSAIKTVSCCYCYYYSHHYTSQLLLRPLRLRRALRLRLLHAAANYCANNNNDTSTCTLPFLPLLLPLLQHRPLVCLAPLFPASSPTASSSY